MDKSKVAHFYSPRCTYHIAIVLAYGQQLSVLGRLSPLDTMQASLPL